MHLCCNTILIAPWLTPTFIITLLLSPPPSIYPDYGQALPIPLYCALSTFITTYRFPLLPITACRYQPLLTAPYLSQPLPLAHIRPYQWLPLYICPHEFLSLPIHRRSPPVPTSTSHIPYPSKTYQSVPDLITPYLSLSLSIYLTISTYYSLSLSLTIDYFPTLFIYSNHSSPLPIPSRRFQSLSIAFYIYLHYHILSLSAATSYSLALPIPTTTQQVVNWLLYARSSYSVPRGSLKWCMWLGFRFLHSSP